VPQASGGCRAAVREVPPVSAFHALHGFMFESTWADSEATYIDSISDAYVSDVRIIDRKNGVCCSLVQVSSVCGFDPVGPDY
jgi:hypothetical protein